MKKQKHKREKTSYHRGELVKPFTLGTAAAVSFACNKVCNDREA
jgi:hypothetical protein